MKNSMMQLGGVYNTGRMIEEYARKYYFPSIDKRQLLMKNDWEKGKEFSAWKTKIFIPAKRKT